MRTLTETAGWIALSSICAILAACTVVPGDEREALDNPWRPKTAVSYDVRKGKAPEAATDGASGGPVITGQASQPAVADAPRMELYQGSGQMVNLGVAAREAAPAPTDGDITLNFEAAEIGEVVKTILGDILQQNYALDENVRGTISLQTSQPLKREALIPTLEKLLQLNGAILAKTNNFYEVVPMEAASVGIFTPRTRLTADRGYQVLILPLRYIAAAEMIKLLEPLKPEKGILEADERRNLLTVAGTQEELTNIRETVSIFDVDQLRGMSVGLFRLQSVEADVMYEELQTIFGDEADGPLAGLVRFTPIERLNALLVITPQPKYLNDVKQWIERLDRAEDIRGLSMYVYYVQNGKAANLADMLSQLFEGQRRARRDQAERPRTPAEPRREAEAATEPGAPTEGGQTGVSVSGALAVNGSNLEVKDVSIIADEENNALLILATPEDYKKVLQAIEKLDVLPLQVLVEATIVEVTLEDELRYGLQWFFKSRFDGKPARGGVGSVPPTPPDILSASYSVFGAADELRLLLTALATDSKLKVISSPSLMVLDNHTATIRVGDQVPVRTSETTNTSGATTTDGTTSALVTSNIQFKDTGVLLEVTPRVNAGGMVVLDITQEVNDVDRTDSSRIDSPTIIQRKIDTSVAVQSGETLVLGGLIRENKDTDSNGVPGLRHVPVLGWLFGSSGEFASRTELVVLITPTAVTNREEARDVTREYRQKLKGVDFPLDTGKDGGQPRS